MRKKINEQINFGVLPIQKIEIDLGSRDELPKVLIGLRDIYSNEEVRQEVFEVLKELIPADTDMNNGRPGMPLWNILVLGTVRLTCNWDYDKLREIANEHRTLRLMLGIGEFDWDKKFALQTLKDNIRLFTPDILDKINQIVVKYGQEIINKGKPVEQLKGSCDSFPVETNVHFPTDISLLFDALRVIIRIIMSLSGVIELSGWRKGKDNIKKAKKLYREISKQSKNEALKIKACAAYLKFCDSMIERAKSVIESINNPGSFISDNIESLTKYITHAQRQIDQIRRRIIEGEKIPHGEKVFSVFEEHTEWISKGKAGTPVELGLNVCVVKDQFGFILYHEVMQNESDVDVAVPIILETKQRFENFNSCSFDKGFHSPTNQTELAKILDNVILPRKGKLSAINKKIESSPEFREARRKHSAVESTINGLEHNGLDRCPDHGIDGFKRYVALAVLARNIQILGHAVQQMKLRKQSRRRPKFRLAA